MKKFQALLQLFGAIVLFAIALATLLNILFISTRPETISVVNAAIGLGVLCICSLAMGRIQWRKGRARLLAARLLAANKPDAPGSGM